MMQEEEVDNDDILGEEEHKDGNNFLTDAFKGIPAE
jgi:hypothetical protein